jgi:hypothetical protein
MVRNRPSGRCKKAPAELTRNPGDQVGVVLPVHHGSVAGPSVGLEGGPDGEGGAPAATLPARGRRSSGARR